MGTRVVFPVPVPLLIYIHVEDRACLIVEETWFLRPPKPAEEKLQGYKCSARRPMGEGARAGEEQETVRIMAYESHIPPTPAVLLPGMDWQPLIMLPQQIHSLPNTSLQMGTRFPPLSFTHM